MIFTIEYSTSHADGRLTKYYVGTEAGAKRRATEFLRHRLSGPWRVTVHEWGPENGNRLVATRLGHGRWHNA